MKNKKLTYILIPLVLMVWGTIIYRIVSVGEVDKDYSKAYTSLDENETNGILTDTFEIHTNYRDPFLGNRTRKSISSENVQTSFTTSSNIISNNATVSVRSSIKWPDIVYSGLIKNQKSNKQLALVQIDGQANIMKLGDVVGEITLSKIFRDSIEVKFYKEKRIIKK